MITIGFFNQIDNLPEVVFKPSLKDLEQTKSQNIKITPFDEDNINKYIQYKDTIGVICYSEVEFICVAKCGVKYAIADFNIAKILQKIADNYLYDTKVLAIIDSKEEIAKAAHSEIDGVILRSLLE